ncbi:hypothetical protein EHS25_001136 [Saitozyma podzolica]|uniref:Uncharacterized protein n=1 Tax=Saitozyma podzolica TaxID=1890683 RepID=A0A427YHB2_9TREE|nr:hypothetical protein EHS25_001136 [Saitozyma podzolica]
MAYDPYGPPPMPPAPLRMDSPRGSHSRSMTVPMPIPMSQPPTSYFPPGSTSSPYYDHGGMPPIGRQGSGSMPSGQNAMGAMRPGSSSNNRRFDPYGNPASPRVAANMIGHPHRRQSQPPPPPEGYFPAQTSAGAPPHPSPTTNTHPASYHYQPPSTAPGSFAEFYPPGAQGASHPAPLQSPMAAPAYTSSATPSTSYAAAPGQSWQGTPAQTSRLIPANQPRDFGPAGHPPSTAGSSGSGPHSQSGSAGGEWGTGTSGAGAGLADTIPTGTGAGSMIPPPPPTSQSTASAGPPSMWDSHGHAHTTGPHGGYVGVTSGGDDWRAGAGASMA